MTKEEYFVSLKQSTKNWRFWAKLLIGTTQITSVFVFIVLATIQDRSVYPFLANLSYFTTQSNIFCGFFFIYSALFHHNEGNGKFDNDEVAKIILTYLMLTILNYNFNQWMSDSPYHFDNWTFLMSFICEHSVVPIIAIGYYLFFYNHEHAKNIKEFSKKWVWYMIIGLVTYLVVFSIISQLARFFDWKPLFQTIDGQETTFVYPFLDWYHGVGIFNIPPWAECIVMLTGIVLLSVGTDYVYTFIVLLVNKKRISSDNQNKQVLQKNNQ